MAQPKMVITVPDKGRQTYQISRLPLIIGSGERCHVQITAAEKVAEQHVRIFREEGDDRLICEDLQSGAPVMVNGEAIGEHIIADGDLITIGDTTLQFYYPLDVPDDAELELNLFAGPGAGKRIALVEGQKVTIGRHSANAIPIPKPNVSGKHAVITPLEFSQVVVTDLDSRNGTRVNGVQIPPKKAVPLNPGDIIDVGPVSIMLVPKGAGPKVKRQRTTVGPPKTPVSRTRVDHDRDKIVAAAEAAGAELEEDPREFIAPPSVGFQKAAGETAPASGSSSAGSTRRAKAVSPRQQLPDAAAGGTRRHSRRPPSRPGSKPSTPSTPAKPTPDSQQKMRALRGQQESAPQPKPMYEATLDMDSPDTPALSEHYAGPPGGESDEPYEDSLIDLKDLANAIGPDEDTVDVAPGSDRAPGEESVAPMNDWDALEREGGDGGHGGGGAPSSPAVHSAPTLVDDNIYADDIPGAGRGDAGPPVPPAPPANDIHSAATMVDDNVYEDDLPGGAPPPPPPPPPPPGGGGLHSAPTMVDDNVYADDIPPGPPAGAPGAGGPPPPPPSVDYRPHTGPEQEFDLNDLAAGADFRPVPGAPPPPPGAPGADRRPPMAPHRPVSSGGGAPASPTGWRPTNGPLPPELEHYRGQIPEVARLVGPALITLPAIPDESGEGADAHLTVQPAVPIPGRLLMGRRRTNGLRLPHGECSGEHTAIEVQNGQVVVRDLGSLNGTFVNGNRIEGPRVLQRFDEVVLGPYRFLFIPPGEAFPG